MAKRINQPLALLLMAALVAVVLSEGSRKPTLWHRTGSSKVQAAWLERLPPCPVPQYFRQWRASFIAANQKQDKRGLVRGIFLGDSAAVEPRTRELFIEAGLSHLLSANGFKCWIVALVIRFTLALLLHLLAQHLSANLVLRARSALVPLSRVAGTWLFWLWSSQSPAITRAVLLVTTKMVLDAVELRVAFVRLLLVQYLCSLAVEPVLWHSPGFQLTYGCLAGILWFPRLVARWRPAPGWGLTVIWDYLCVSTGAVLGGLPCSILIFDEINFMSLTTSWFAVPLIGFFIMPLGLTQMLLLAPGLGLANQDWARSAIDWLGAAAVSAAELERQALVLWLNHMPALRWP